MSIFSKFEFAHGVLLNQFPVDALSEHVPDRVAPTLLRLRQKLQISFQVHEVTLQLREANLLDERSFEEGAEVFEHHFLEVLRELRFADRNGIKVALHDLVDRDGLPRFERGGGEIGS